MKKVYLLFFILVNATVGLSAQNALPHKVYCEIVGTQKLINSKVTITLDFGQTGAASLMTYKNLLMDKNGKPIIFNSMVDAMNMMGELGWTFEQAYVVSLGTSGASVYHWLLSKYIEERDVIEHGIKTKAQYNQEQQGQQKKSE